MKKYLAAAIILFIALYLFAGPIPVPPSLGRGDFRAYWSASYLLAHSQNFADPDLLMVVEQQHTMWEGVFSVITWNPPWLLTLLLPYTQFSFVRATWLWFLTNIFLIFSGAVLVWKTYSQGEKRVSQKSWIAPILALLFLPSLVALMMGQVNTLVFWGLAAFLYWEHQDKQTAAGASLALTLVKPHLVYITLPILLLRALWQRNWRLFVGLGSTVLGLTMVVFLLRPSFLADYSQTVSSSNLLNWETPTLGGILEATWGWQWAKLMGLFILPASIIICWQQKKQVSTILLVHTTLLISVITAPFGWGYDVIVLLVPLLQIVVWVAARQYGRWERISLALTLLLINILAVYQRTLDISEVQTFWLPIAIAAVYTVAYYRRQSEIKMEFAAGSG